MTQPPEPKSAMIRRAITHVQSGFPSGGGDWSKKRFETWVAAVEDLDPESVHEAARALVREWTDDRGRSPLPGHLREGSLKKMRQKAYAETGERNGCRFVEAEPWPDDPPGTVRYVVIQPDGSRRPRNGRIKGEGRHGRRPDDSFESGALRPKFGLAAVPSPEEAFGDNDEPYPRGPRNGGQ